MFCVRREFARVTSISQTPGKVNRVGKHALASKETVETINSKKAPSTFESVTGPPTALIAYHHHF